MTDYTKLYIGGAWVDPVGAGRLEVVDPTTEQVCATVPEGTAADADRQTSTSSSVELEFHTETAFHRHKPRYLLLLCLKGDPEARTMLSASTTRPW